MAATPALDDGKQDRHVTGRQAGLATSYHQLGVLAHDRGDYETAEQRYTQSLEIDERLGNQTGLATAIRRPRC